MNKIRIISLILIFNLTACGFKVVNQSDLINYRIDSINTTGERKIAYRIKSNLLKINLSTLWRWTKDGKLNAYGIGNRIFYKKDEILNSLIKIENVPLQSDASYNH